MGPCCAFSADGKRTRTFVMNSPSITCAFVAMMPGRTRNPVPTEPSPVIMAIDGSDSAAISAEDSGRPGSRAAGAWRGRHGRRIRDAAGSLAGDADEATAPLLAGSAAPRFRGDRLLVRGETSRPKASA